MKGTLISILIAGMLIVGAMFMGDGNKKLSTIPGSNITIVDGKQVIEIKAKGGYSPSLTTAKADIPTVIKVKTNGTYDCTVALSIPSIGYSANLTPTGETLIEVPTQTAGSKLTGLCSMGMYNFSIKFI